MTPEATQTETRCCGNCIHYNPQSKVTGIETERADWCDHWKHVVLSDDTCDSHTPKEGTTNA